ncbi:MAG TPA: ABC transporter substrate-binding protein [Terriglobales bacterium]
MLAAASLACIAHSATRPHYGGTLRVMTSASIATLDPARSRQLSVAEENTFRLLFDTLVTMDSRGPQAALAISWRADSTHQKWVFVLRRGTTFSDGSPLTPEVAAASLRMANAGWKVQSTADGVTVELSTPDAELPAELALARNSIVRRDGTVLGTGPFVVTRWDEGKKLTLAVREDYWKGRAFLDSIEIEMGRNQREQQIALDLGRADIIEVAPDQYRRASLEGRRLVRSRPAELLAVVFARDAQSPEEARLREALSLVIDRKQINQVLLQGGGEVSGGLLPNWVSGYNFLFASDLDLARAGQIRGEVKRIPPWSLGYEANSGMARLVAERIALDARAAGLTIQPGANPTDARIARIPLSSGDGNVVLRDLASWLGVAVPALKTSDPETLYAAESELLHSGRIIPLLHLPVVAATGDSVRGLEFRMDGTLDLPNAWLAAEKP